MLNVTNTIPEKPAAKIIIDGLFVLCIDEQTRKADVWVYGYANEHDFLIRVSEKKYSDTSEPGKGGKLIRQLDGKKEIKQIHGG